MERAIQYFYIVLVSFVIAACGGGGGSGNGGDGNSGGLSIPADAAEFNATNAEDFARAGLAQIEFVTATTDLALKSDSETPTKGALRLAIDQIFRPRAAQKSLAGRSATEFCNGVDASSGSITYSTTETSNSESGSIVFDNCDLGGVVVDGSFSFSSTFNEISGSYTAEGDGSLTFSFDTEQFTFAMDFDVSGNDISGEFTETFNFSLTGIPGGGFLLNTTQPITGVDFDVTGGQIVLSGANSTRIRVTVVNTNLVDIELDDGSGTFVLFLEDVPI